MISRLKVARLIVFPVLFGLVCFTPVTAVAEELDQSKDRLAEIQKKIDNTLRDLKEKRSEAGSLDQDLATLQSEMRKVAGQVKKSDRELKVLQQQLDSRQKDLERLKALQVQNREQLQRRLVALYKTGDTGLLKALLTTTESPQVLAEKYLFLSRLVEHDRQLMEDYRAQELAYQKAIADLEELRLEQTKTVERRRRESNKLKSAQKTKARLLARVRNDEKLLDKMLTELRAKAARLNDLVKKLESEQTHSYTEKLAGLDRQKGRLPWPLDGRVRVGFGTSRHNDYGATIESHGLEIVADIGSPVAAIADGKVIYASQLRGYGKLMIVDHGDKNYSLYAQLARFSKRVGDQVRSGEQIAFTGYEGREYLYFEIRHGGKPVDPKGWLTPRS